VFVETVEYNDWWSSTKPVGETATSVFATDLPEWAKRYRLFITVPSRKIVPLDRWNAEASDAKAD
jgi:hypothetical protein